MFSSKLDMLSFDMLCDMVLWYGVLDIINMQKEYMYEILKKKLYDYYSKYTVLELKKRCKECGIQGYSKKNKATLIDLLTKDDISMERKMERKKER